VTSPRLIDIGLTNSYVCKPIDFDEFAEQVRQIGAYWLAVTNRHSISSRASNPRVLGDSGCSRAFACHHRGDVREQVNAASAAAGRQTDARAAGCREPLEASSVAFVCSAVVLSGRPPSLTFVGDQQMIDDSSAALCFSSIRLAVDQHLYISER